MTTMSFRAPEKTIITPDHVELFKKSSGCEELLGFITALMTACKTSKMTQTEMTEVSVSSKRTLVGFRIIPNTWSQTAR